MNNDALGHKVAGAPVDWDLWRMGTFPVDQLRQRSNRALCRCMTQTTQPEGAAEEEQVVVVVVVVAIRRLRHRPRSHHTILRDRHPGSPIQLLTIRRFLEVAPGGNRRLLAASVVGGQRLHHHSEVASMIR